MFITHRALLAKSGAVAPITGGYQDRSIVTANQTNYNLGTVSIGAAAADRLCIVLLSYEGANSANTVTLAGTSLTKIADQGNTNSEVTIWTGVIASGASGNLSMTGSGGSSSCGGVVYSLYGANATAYDTLISNANPCSGSLNIPAGGFALALAVSRATTSCTWTGLTEQFDEAQEAGNPSWWSGADGTTEGEPTTITADFTTETQQAMAAASFQPA